MMALAPLQELEPGSHVCWVLRDSSEYASLGAAVLAEALLTNEKPVVFGPEGGARDALSDFAALSADPGSAFLGGTELVPSLMASMFEEQSALARTQGYQGLRLVADMDWLLPLRPADEDILAFELLLDRQSYQLGATMVCVYRTDSFVANTLSAASCVHPTTVGAASPVQFTLIAGQDDGWRLLGDIDIAVGVNFRVAIETAIAAGPCVIDASGLEFLDVGGMRHLADAAQRHGTPVRVIGARSIVALSWRSAGFAELAPSVEFADQPVSGR